jgi:hypothetical protein
MLVGTELSPIPKCLCPVAFDSMLMPSSAKNITYNKKINTSCLSSGASKAGRPGLAAGSAEAADARRAGTQQHVDLTEK